MVLLPHPLVVVVENGTPHEFAVACTFRAAANSMPVVSRASGTTEKASMDWFRSDTRRLAVRVGSIRQIRSLYMFARSARLSAHVEVLGGHRVLAIAPSPGVIERRAYRRTRPLSDLRRSPCDYYNAALAAAGRGPAPVGLRVREDVDSFTAVTDAAHVGFVAAITVLADRDETALFRRWSFAGFRTDTTFHAASELDAAEEDAAALWAACDDEATVRLLVARGANANR